MNNFLGGVLYLRILLSLNKIQLSWIYIQYSIGVFFLIWR